MSATKELQDIFQDIFQEQLKGICDRIAEGKQTESDNLDLRWIIINGDNNLLQIGENTNIGEGRDIQVCDHIYQGQGAKAIENAIHQAVSERNEFAECLMQKLDEQIEETEEQIKELQKKRELEKQKQQELEEQKKQELDEEKQQKLDEEIEVSKQTSQDWEEEEINVIAKQKEYFKQKDYIQEILSCAEA